MARVSDNKKNNSAIRSPPKMHYDLVGLGVALYQFLTKKKKNMRRAPNCSGTYEMLEEKRNKTLSKADFFMNEKCEHLRLNLPMGWR